MSETTNISLDQVRPSYSAKIVMIDGGWGFRQRISQLGLHIGDEITLVRGGPFGGPLLISYNSAFIAIGRRMARRIIVEVEDNGKKENQAKS
jgi:Fe2+ transport system protein FeoA